MQVYNYRRRAIFRRCHGATMIVAVAMAAVIMQIAADPGPSKGFPLSNLLVSLHLVVPFSSISYV